MTGANAWIPLAVLAVGLLIATRFAWKKAAPVLVRVAAFLFVAAGTIGADGWLGDRANDLVARLTAQLDEWGAELLGGPIVLFLIAILVSTWVLSLLPKKWFSYDPSDLLVVSGLLFPPLVDEVPGLAGDLLQGVVGLGADIGMWILTGLFG